MKNDSTHKWIKYYCNSLVDGELLDVKAKECEGVDFFESIDDLNSERLISIYEKFVASSKNKKPDREESQENDELLTILISPFHLSGKFNHNKKSKKEVFPFWIHAELNRNGELKINAEETSPPWFLRSVLEPLSSELNSDPIISSIEKVDAAFDSHTFNYDSWTTYWQSIEAFFKKVTGNSYADFSIDGVITKNKICVIKAKDSVKAQNIFSLYNDLKIEKTIPKLLKNLLSFSKNRSDGLVDEDELFLTQGHYGQYSNGFALSNSQRKSLLLFEKERNGSVLAVNGPPGTGKTTLLQSIVANEVVKSVLKGNSPPKIVASSTNNQAITNILDGFGDGLERWLPQLSSLGAYMISSDSKKQSVATKKGYQLLTRSNGDFEGYYFTDFHTADIDELESYYITCYSKIHGASEDNSVKKITLSLKRNVKKSSKKIDGILSTLREVNEVEKNMFSLNELPNYFKTISEIKVELETYDDKRKSLLVFRDDFLRFKYENKLYAFASFIPFYKRAYERKLSLFLIDSDNESIKGLATDSEVEDALLSLLNRVGKDIQKLKKELVQKEKTYAFLSSVKSNFDVVFCELEELWSIYLSSKNDKEKESLIKEYTTLGLSEKANRILDVSYRHVAFLDAMHYWEGAWIIKQKEEELKVTKGLVSRKNTFTRISYLTPLFISTFHSLPAFCSYFEKTSDGWNSKPIYELFDLIIVDEAGQVSPEVGVASFSLAKKALVVGDIHQIEPVWNIAYEKIDKGNLMECQLLENYEFETLKELGVVCSSGSLMHLAQKASSVEVTPTLGGTMLTEHRRCVDELVAFSNEYIYDNMLQPMVGSSKGRWFKNNKEEIFIPALGYLHVSGVSEKANGSTFNTAEAVAITKWVKKYGGLISAHYRKDLKECIAVITPFSKQKNELYRQFSLFDVNTDITIGTVHALQGAERPIVIFSPTYGINQADGQLFFDSGYNMLNVALTRAKQHFIVMGNMQLFNPFNKYKPSGGLAKFLFSSDNNELSSSFLFEDKIIISENRIDTLEKHQRCLKRAFEIAKTRIVIVSPFISKYAIQADNLLEGIQKAVSNNVKVSIYTDKYLDMPNGKLKKSAEEGRSALTNSGAELFILNGIHNKAIIIDDEVLIEGSFNWLSALRDKQNPYYRYEVSQVIKDQEAKVQIPQLINNLTAIYNK